MKQFYINSRTDSTYSKDNMPNNNQLSNDPTKEFLNSLNEILTKQNQNFLSSMQVTLTKVILEENRKFL